MPLCNRFNAVKQARIDAGLDADKYCDMDTIADWKMDLMLFEVLKALNLGDSTSVHAAYQTFKNKNTKETNEARALRATK